MQLVTSLIIVIYLLNSISYENGRFFTITTMSSPVQQAIVKKKRVKGHKIKLWKSLVAGGGQDRKQKVTRTKPELHNWC